MHDAVAGGDHVDVLERRLGPLDEVETILVAALLDGTVLLEGIRIEAGVLDGQRVVDDQLGRHHRVDLGRVAALLRDRVTQAGEIDQRGLAEDVMADHARRIPGKVQIALALNDLLERIGQRCRFAAAHQLLGQHAGGIGQLVIGARLNGFNRLAGVEVVKPGAWQRFAVFCIHAGRTQSSYVPRGKAWRNPHGGLPIPISAGRSVVPCAVPDRCTRHSAE